MLYYIVAIVAAIYFLPDILGSLFYVLKVNNIKKTMIYRSRIVVILDKLFPGIYEWVSGITFGKFIFVKKTNELPELDFYKGEKEIRQEYYRMIINHEVCHSKQQAKLGGLFFVLYLIMFLYNFVKYKNYKLAYYYISYEQEARVCALREEIYYCKRMIFNVDLMTSDSKRKKELIDKYSNKISELINEIRQV